MRPFGNLCRTSIDGYLRAKGSIRESMYKGWVCLEVILFRGFGKPNDGHCQLRVSP
jgi:hypothetical protein